MERDVNELCIFLEGLAPWARPGCLLKEMTKHVRGHASCEYVCVTLTNQQLSDIMKGTCCNLNKTQVYKLTYSTLVECHLHDVLWSRWAVGIHTEAIVMLTRRGMNRQWDCHACECVPPPLACTTHTYLAGEKR